MRAALKLLTIAGLAVTAAACHKPASQSTEQNVVIDSGNVPDNADIEALPADESSGTSSNELANGNDNADVGDLDTGANSY
jgi:hypothetical protein